MLMNVKKLLSLPLTDVWISYDSHWTLRPLDEHWVPVNGTEKWGWIFKDSGIPAVLRLVDSYQSNRSVLLSTLKNCTGSIHNWWSGQSDFFYIPHAESSTVISILSQMGSFGLFLEIAFPTLVECFLRKDVYVRRLLLCTTFTPMRENITFYRKHCKRSYLYLFDSPFSAPFTYYLFQFFDRPYELIHPVKLSRGKSHVDFMIEEMGVQLSRDSIGKIHNLVSGVSSKN